MIEAEKIRAYVAEGTADMLMFFQYLSKILATNFLLKKQEN